jgi:hypothetical protein
VGKLHIAVGDMDNYFLNLGVYRMETFLESTKQAGKGRITLGRSAMGGPQATCVAAVDESGVALHHGDAGGTECH